MSNGQPDAIVARVAVAREGVFDRSDAHNSGFTDAQIRSRLRRKLWVEVLPGVYRNGATPVHPESLRRAALLWAGPDAALSHRSAGVLLGLDGVTESLPEIVVPMHQHPRSPHVDVHRSHELLPRDIVRVSDLRCTAPARTIVDLAGILDDETLELALESARRLRKVTIPVVRARLEANAGRGRAGATRLRHLLDQLDGREPAESILEVRVARRLRATQLPEPVRQFHLRAFGRRYRLDFAWPDKRVALECDGRRYHEFQRDRTKWRQVGASGWRVLPVTWADERRGWNAVVSELAAALVARP